MRPINDESRFTPFGKYLRTFLRTCNLCITNIDYVLEDYSTKQIMFLEEKQNGGFLHRGQKLTFQVVHKLAEASAKHTGYDYWGFFLLTFPRGALLPAQGMTLNYKPITEKQLKDHLEFKVKFCESLF